MYVGECSLQSEPVHERGYRGEHSGRYRRVTSELVPVREASERTETGGGLGACSVLLRQGDRILSLLNYRFWICVVICTLR